MGEYSEAFVEIDVVRSPAKRVVESSAPALRRYCTYHSRVVRRAHVFGLAGIADLFLRRRSTPAISAAGRDDLGVILAVDRLQFRQACGQVGVLVRSPWITLDPITAGSASELPWPSSAARTCF